MAGCCPPVPPSSAIGGSFAEASGPESDIRPGETVECYMARGGNTSGMHDDATENVENKIENSSIPIVRSHTAASVDVVLKLTAGSTRTATTWAVSPMPPGLTLVANHLTGTFSTLGQVYKIEVTASDADGVIDVRGFTVAPSVGGEDDEIRLISPLPGGIVNSLFGPRMHPKYKVMKPHNGIDMKMSNYKVQDVVAAADGEIILCGGDPTVKTGYGVRIWIKHVSGSGKHICTTTYNHLAKIYVAQGQKVMAGQKIGLEGSTGGSTGNHLHFECKLPDGKFIDPKPLINGALTVADKTLPNGDADPASLSTNNSSASLSAQESEARQSSCAPFGPTYHAANPPETSDPVPLAPPSDDPFELAWFFTMTHEVGPFWDNTYPSDPDVIAGAIETKPQRKKVGYVNSPKFPGGETKFGVAQKPNPRIDVTTVGYEDAKKTGFNNYWKSSKCPCGSKGKLGIMMFDMNYLHGDGNARQIFTNAFGVPPSAYAGLGTTNAECQTLNAARVAFITSIPRPAYTKGWLKRANDCLAYVSSLA